MENTNSMYISDEQELRVLMETVPVRDSSKTPSSDYREREREFLTIKKSLPPDHMTATYRG
jgi:hypothetical protein